MSHQTTLATTRVRRRTYARTLAASRATATRRFPPPRGRVLPRPVRGREKKKNHSREEETAQTRVARARRTYVIARASLASETAPPTPRASAPPAAARPRTRACSEKRRGARSKHAFCTHARARQRRGPHGGQVRGNRGKASKSTPQASDDIISVEEGVITERTNDRCVQVGHKRPGAQLQVKNERNRQAFFHSLRVDRE